MTTTARTAGLVWPTLLTLLALGILVSLGSWQMSRKTEKEALIAKLEARAKAEPVPLAEARRRFEAGEDVGFLRVVAEGKPAGGKERLLYAPDKRLGPGYDVYQPLMLDQATALWVNRGFLPERLKEQPAMGGEAGEQGGGVSIVGVVRMPEEKNTFSPDNEPAKNMWYWRDLSGMHASAFAGTGIEPVGFFVEESPREGQAPDSFPRPGVTQPNLANRHLEYALTWYGLALVLAGVYAAFAWSRLTGRR